MTKRLSIFLLAGALAFLGACGGSTKEAVPDVVPAGGETPPPGGCSPARFVEVESKDHIAPPAKGNYNSTPPTSGNHYSMPARAGAVYDEPIENETQVHNLEHGHVLLQYRGLSEPDIAKLGAILRADSKMVLVAPYPAMIGSIAFTAWGVYQVCDGVDGKTVSAAKDFIKTYRDKAPESVP